MDEEAIKLRLFRMRAGVSMREVALRLELREPSVSLIERGLMKAPADFAERFERAVQEITRERLEGSLAGVS